jgi:hypothetical protein
VTTGVLLNPQGFHGVQPGGARGGQPHGQQRYCPQDDRNSYKYDRIPGLHPEEDAGEEAGEPERRANSQNFVLSP